MRASEIHFNTKASDCAIEEIYTDLDICKYDGYVPKIGYSFYYPYRFVNDPAQLKAVGVRYLNIQPTSHTMAFTIEISYYTANDAISDRGTLNTNTYEGQYSVSSENNLLEALNGMCDYINKVVIKYLKYTYGLEIKYNYDNNTVCFYIYKSSWDGAYEPGLLRITGDDEFYKFLNQPINISIPKLSYCTYEQFFTNVWDRSYIEFHATFSDSNRNFIGINGDFYTRPSLFYLVPSNVSEFNIIFSDDNGNLILPRYCKLVIQLCFVLNYKMFKI